MLSSCFCLTIALRDLVSALGFAVHCRRCLLLKAFLELSRHPMPVYQRTTRLEGSPTRFWWLCCYGCWISCARSQCWSWRFRSLVWRGCSTCLVSCWLGAAASPSRSTSEGPPLALICWRTIKDGRWPSLNCVFWPKRQSYELCDEMSSKGQAIKAVLASRPYYRKCSYATRTLT